MNEPFPTRSGDDYLDRELADFDREHRKRWPEQYAAAGPKPISAREVLRRAGHALESDCEPVPVANDAGGQQHKRRARDAAPEIHSDPFEPFYASGWDGEPVPERQWIVRDWIPMHAVTLVAGKGGTGKSLALQQWASAIGVGAAFMGLRSAAPFPALYVNCEDTADELHIRQDAIARAMGRSMAGFGQALAIADRIGLENALGVTDERGRFLPSELYREIRGCCLASGIRLVVLDNAMQMFVGNPNDNGEVTRFLNALARLALDIDGAVILAAHTAKSDGSEFMGCMAWENGVRSRLYLTRDEEDEASDVRTLSRNKSNMAAIGASIEMEWHAGAFRALDRTADDSSDAKAEAAFLACLEKATADRRNVSHSPSANYAPTVFAGMKEAAKIRKTALEKAMQRLFDRGEIIANEPLWKDDQRRQKYGLARCPNPRPNPRPQTVPKPPEPLPQARPHTPLYTSYIPGGGPDGPPPPDEDADGGNVPPIGAIPNPLHSERSPSDD